MLVSLVCANCNYDKNIDFFVYNIMYCYVATHVKLDLYMTALSKR